MATWNHLEITVWQDVLGEFITHLGSWDTITFVGVHNCQIPVMFNRLTDITSVTGIDTFNANETASADLGIDWESQDILDACRTYAQAIFTHIGGTLHVPASVNDALANVADNSQDVVWIDWPDRSVETTTSIVTSWYSKVKPGGIIAGKGWFNESVRDAVDAVLDTNGITEAKWTTVGYSWFAMKPA